MARILFFVVIGLHAWCLLDVVRRRRELFWVPVLLLPIAGVIAFVVIELFPEWVDRRRRTPKTLALDPDGSLAGLRQTYRRQPGIESRKALAERLLLWRIVDEAIAVLADPAGGDVRSDPVLLALFARAFLMRNAPEEAIDLVRQHRNLFPAYADAELDLTWARALESNGDDEGAEAAYRALVPYYPGEEARGRLAAFLARTGKRAEAEGIWGDILGRVTPGRAIREREWVREAQRELGLHVVH